MARDLAKQLSAGGPNVSVSSVNSMLYSRLTDGLFLKTDGNRWDVNRKNAEVAKLLQRSPGTGDRGTAIPSNAATRAGSVVGTERNPSSDNSERSATPGTESILRDEMHRGNLAGAHG